MRSNSITEHFEKIIKDYMVTSFTGQKLDQTFGDQYWEFTDEGGLMKVLEAICDVAEDALKGQLEIEEELEDLKGKSNSDLTDEIVNLKEVVEKLRLRNESLESRLQAKVEPVLNPPVYNPPPFGEVTMTGPTVVVDAPPIEPAPTKKRAPRADKGKSRKKCVACEGSGKNSKGEDCPICKPSEESLDKQEIVDAIAKQGSPESAPVPPLTVVPSSTPPWLAQPAAPAAPAFFPPPPPPPYWNPNA